MSILLKTGEVVEKKTDNSIALFRLAFRSFFLLGSLFSIISLLIWSQLFSGEIQISVYGYPLWWHIHEMLFGFVVAIIIGFLLTAVQSWTGVPGIKGPALMGLVALWLLGRLSLFLPALFPGWLIVLLDVSFLPVAASALAYPLIKVKLWRNMIFIPLLLLMTGANVGMHYAVLVSQPDIMHYASQSMILLVTLLMSIMGGRVFPMFTANGTQTKKVSPIKWLEILAIGSILLVLIASFDLIDLPIFMKASIFFFAAIVHSLRAFRWRIWVTFKTPLVWSLHLSYWCIPLGMLMFGLAEISDAVIRSQALHTLTIGAVGTMVIAMISRVSLGHTGRTIKASKLMILAFIAIFSAFLIRVFGVYWFEDYLTIIYLATLLWVFAYGSFLISYLPILTKPRSDGSPG